MNVIKNSFFYKLLKYINEIHEYSFIYKTRKNEKKYDIKPKQGMYRYTFVYRFLCAVGKLFSYLFQAIHKACKSSLIINGISHIVTDIKYKKLRVFNQFMISFIVGYLLANTVWGMFASYKIKYIVVFVVLIAAVNVMVYFVDKYKESSAVMWVVKKVMD